MSEFIAALFVIALVLAIVAFVGHFLWLMAAAIVRSWKGEEPFPARQPQKPTGLLHEDDLTVTERQLRKLYQSKAISSRQWDELQDVFRRERARQQLDRVARWAPIKLKDHDVAASKPATATSDESDALEIVAFVDEPQAPSEPAADIYRLKKPPAAPAKADVTFTPVALGADVAGAVEIFDEPPRGTIADLLQAFMEERNIRWGELISGMLIVGSAVGLVISLWATLQHSIPYFPALLFMLVTSAIHGAGLYTLNRWKLKSTSRGLLVIAALLVPLNFLAAIVLSEQSPEQARREVTDPLYLTAVVVGLLAYSAISYSSGRVLLRGKWWPMFLALMGPSVAQLYIVRYAEPNLPLLELNKLAALPFVAFLLAVGTQLRKAAEGRRLSGRRLVQTQLLLGVALFSVVMPVGLLNWKTHAIERTLAGLSPGFTLVAAMILSTGLLIHRRVTQPVLATARTVGTALAMVGSGLMIATVLLAWPRPELLIAVGLLAFAVLTVLAILGDLPMLNVPATASFALASLVGMHLLVGTIEPGDGGTSGYQLVNVLLMGRSGIALAVLSAVAGAVAYTMSRKQQPSVAASYSYSAIGLSALSLMVAFFAGFLPDGVDGDWVTPIFAVYAALALVFAYRRRSAPAAWAGSGLLLLTTIHALILNDVVANFLFGRGWVIYQPGVVAMFAHATLAILVAAFAALRNRPQSDLAEGDSAIRRKVIEPLMASGVLTSGLVLPFDWSFNEEFIARHAGYAFWGAAIWLVSAFLMRSPLLFFAGQAITSVATGLAVTAVCMRQAWWSDNYFEPRHIQAQLATLAGLSLLFIVARIAARRSTLARAIMSSLQIPFDRLLLAAVTVGIVILSALACGPGIAAEVTPVGPRLALVESDVFALMALAAIFVAALFTAAFAVFRGNGSTSEVATAHAAGVLSVVAFIGLTAFWSPGRSLAVWSHLGVSHVDAYGAGTWIALAVAVGALLVSLWERMRPATVLLLVLAGSAVPLLVAAAAEVDLASATALRFGLPLYGLAIAGLLAFRVPLRTFANRIGVNRPEPLPFWVIDGVRQLSLALTLSPVWTLTARAVACIGDGHTLAGPQLQTLLTPGELASLIYAVPIWLLAAGFLIYAVRERRSEFALAASLSLQAGVSVALLITRWSAGEHIDVPALVELLQANALCLGIGSLAWLAIRRRIEDFADRPSTAFALQLQLAIASTSALIIWAAVSIIYSPARLPSEVGAIGTWPSYAALLVAALACFWSSTKSRLDAIAQGVVPVGIGLTTLLAATSVQISTTDAWFAYHVLSGGWCLLLAGTVIAYYVQQLKSATRDLSSALVGWASGLGAAALGLAIRGELTDPSSPHWSAGLAAWVAMAAVAFGLIARLRPAAYVSTAIAMLAAALFWLPIGNLFPQFARAGSPAGLQANIVFVEAILIAAASMGLLWLAVELYWQRRWNCAFDLRTSLVSVHRPAGVATLAVGWFVVAACMAAKAFALNAGIASFPVISDVGGRLLVASIGLLLVGTLWDRTARQALFALYVFGLMPVAIALDSLGLLPRDLTFAIGCTLCGYVFVTSLLWSQHGAISALAQSAGIPAATFEPNRIGQWLQTANLGISAVAVSITTWAVLSLPDFHQRFWAASASALLIPAMTLLGVGRNTNRMRWLSLSLVAVVGVECAWAYMDVDNTPVGWLHRSIRLLVVLAGMTFIYTALAGRVVKETNSWYIAMRRAAATVAGASLIVLASVLMQQGSLYQPFVGAPVENAEIIAVAVVLVGLAAALVSMAMLPGADPLELTDRGRMLYVYAAEAVIALLFLHLRLTTPELFGQYLRPYWPLIVIAIAFFGIGAGELFRRKNWLVLSEPLERTGAFLPLLPALGFWAVSSETNYSAVLFIIGLMYIVASMWRKSFVYGLAAALAGNGALWALLDEHGWQMLAHPQMWFIPPALSVLTAAQINRRKLDEAQLTSLRYLCVTVIYVSSTGEMFITGVADSLWLPMILAALSVAGVFAGIIMRVRAFLYLGSSFLMLSIVSMVWHAAQKLEHVWPWWAFGIVLGLSILALFGLFEKKRNDALLLLDRVRQWEP